MPPTKARASKPIHCTQGEGWKHSTIPRPLLLSKASRKVSGIGRHCAKTSPVHSFHLLGATMGCGSAGALTQAFQISGALDSSNEVRPNDAARPPTLQRSLSDTELLQCSALFQHTRQGEIKAAMGPPYSQKLPPIARTKHPKCRHSIQGHPAEHEPRPPALPVFQHDDQIVPKVQISLEGTRCLECSAA